MTATAAAAAAAATATSATAAAATTALVAGKRGLLGAEPQRTAGVAFAKDVGEGG